ncbi:hypothetical protein IWW48_004771 [Coemansia sp. RSA 1200]|nr:hypothetical protein IWW48_004771 [Coemansia sp. RSA 1200]
MPGGLQRLDLASCHTRSSSISDPSSANSKGKNATASSAQFDPFTTSNYYTLEPQLPMDSTMRRSSSGSASSTLPRNSTCNSLADLAAPGSAFLNPADVFSTPMLADSAHTPTSATTAALAAAFASTSAQFSSASVPATPSQAFGFFGGAPATAPLKPLNYVDMHQQLTQTTSNQDTTATPYVDALLLSAYESYLNTPVNAGNASFVESPTVRQQQQQQHPMASASAANRLFAPLDEIRGKDAVLRDDLIHQIAHADPAFRQNLVHALVNMIKPAVAYQQIADSDTSPLPPAVSATSLLAQAQHLASTTATVLDVQDDRFAAEVPATNEMPLLDSLLGLLSPPTLADSLSPPSAASDMLFSPMMAVVSPDDMLHPNTVNENQQEADDGASDDASDDDDDEPLAQYALGEDRQNEDDAVATTTATKRKRSMDDDGESAKNVSRFHCDICNRGFSRQYNMRTHRLTHNPRSFAARPYNCNHCVRSFTRKHDLVRHQVLHDASDAFKCSVCSRAFARLDVLDRHVRALHKD